MQRPKIAQKTFSAALFLATPDNLPGAIYIEASAACAPAETQWGSKRRGFYDTRDLC